jgi:outer membrane protein assembly factor BamA
VVLSSEFLNYFSVPGYQAGNDSGLGLLVRWDTRDSVYFPMSGDYLQASVMFFGEAIAGEHHFVKWDLDLRHYFSIDERQSVSVNGLLLAEAGSPPFYLMNMLGGDKVLRGYFKGTKRDRCVTALQAEYKWIFIPRFAVTVHAGLGAAANEVTKFSTAYMLWSAGFGLRFFLDEASRMTFRADMGFGRDDMGLYLVAGEAF